MVATDPTLASIHRLVIESPWDDAPRLIYANALDDAGLYDRAEFIRVQIELTKTPATGLLPGQHGRCVYCDDRNCACDCPHCILRRREQELLAHDREWAEEELIKPVSGHWSRWPGIIPDQKWRWSRGFISRLDGLSAEALVGKLCQRCLGSRYDHQKYSLDEDDVIYDWWECHECDGHGLIGGIAQKIGAAVPIEEIGLIDKRPSTNAISSSFFIDRERDPNRHNTLDPEVRLPRPIWYLLRGGRRLCYNDTADSGGHYSYKTETEAVRGLAQAAARYCRKLNGLNDE